MTTQETFRLPIPKFSFRIPYGASIEWDAFWLISEKEKLRWFETSTNFRINMWEIKLEYFKDLKK